MHNYKILIEVCLLFCIYAFQYDAHAIEIKTLSFNILTSGRTLDCCGKWDDRKSSVLQLLKENQFDVVGLQEVKKDQLDYLRNNMEGEYLFSGISRKEKNSNNEYAPILYKKSNFHIISNARAGTFYYTDSPNDPDSDPNEKWGDRRRICSWIGLEDNSNRFNFYVFNTHFVAGRKDKEISARNLSSSLLSQKIKEIAGNNPVIVLGDFNATENKTPITSIINERDLIDTYRYIHPIRDKNSVLGSSERIDFIFVSKHFNVMNADINQSKTTGEQKHLSDHYPINATLSTLNNRKRNRKNR